MLSQETTSIIKQSFSMTPDNLSEALRNGSVSKTVDDLQKIYSLSPENTASLENTLYLVFIGMIPISNLQAKLLENFDLQENVTLNILDDLATTLLKDEILQTLLSVEKTVFADDINNVIQNKQEPSETEAAPNTIPPLRTMEEDRAQEWIGEPEEIIHTSSQETLLQEEPLPPQSETPLPPPPKVS